MSGEDLANVGPVALLNDLAAMAVLGMGDVERNGHHYFAGLGMFPPALQRAGCSAHPDLYAMRPEGFAALRIVACALSIVAGHDAAHEAVEQGNGEGGVAAGSAPHHALADQLRARGAEGGVLAAEFPSDLAGAADSTALLYRSYRC